MLTSGNSFLHLSLGSWLNKNPQLQKKNDRSMQHHHEGNFFIKEFIDYRQKLTKHFLELV